MSTSPPVPSFSLKETHHHQDNGKRPLILCALLAGIVLSTSPGIARPALRSFTSRDTTRPGEPATPASDTTSKMTQAPLDTTGRADTLGRMSSPPLLGTYDRGLDSAHYITKEGMHWLDYRSATGILETLPGVFVMDQSSIGQYSMPSFRGGDWRGIAFTLDGRPLNDPASGIFNADHFSPDYADRIEVITGPRAFLYGLNSAAGAVNFVTKNYNSNRPFTKIIYSEGAYNYQLTDGTFSQNISRKINVTAGFQHQSTDGRFPNSGYEDWNMRVKARYNASKDLNVIVSEYLTSTFTNLNGGIDFEKDGAINSVTPRIQSVMSLSSYEKITRHDVDLSLVGTFLGDSSNVSLLTLYYSNNLREFREGEPSRRTAEPFIQADHTSSWMGAQFTQNFDSEFQKFNLGSALELRQIEGSPTLGRHRNVIGSLWAKEDILLGKTLTLSGYGRYDRYLHKDYAGAGADATLRPTDALSLFGGLSYSRRLPTYEELFWNDANVVRQAGIVAEKHANIEAGAELRLAGLGSIRITYFHRNIEHPILLQPYAGIDTLFPGAMFVNGDRIATNGFEGKLDVRLWVLTLEGTAMTMLQQSGGSTLENFPKLTAQGGIYYWNTILQGNLELKAGFRGRYLSSWRGELFNPVLLAYVPNQGTKMGLGASVDFFLIARLGDAYIHFIWENLTDVQYFTASFYPVEDRAIRFGVAWEFLN